ncbi:MAG: DUF1697 domain-containing protein [Alphaproteobacteria bacterium]|nr:DUF1697 domain-containing protein [Alphaproteobacteria bacterium]
MTWVALLRAINVGGNRKVPMADLRAVTEGLGWTRVRTHLASGNLLFDADGERAALIGVLEPAIRDRFGFEVPVVLRTHEELVRVVREVPYDPPDRTFVWFLDRVPGDDASERIEAIPRKEGERWLLVGDHLYTDLPSAADTKFTADRIDRATRATATARNLRTTTALRDLSG